VGFCVDGVEDGRELVGLLAREGVAVEDSGGGGTVRALLFAGVHGDAEVDRLVAAVRAVCEERGAVAAGAPPGGLAVPR
jgi:hypothetical protein